MKVFIDSEGCPTQELSAILVDDQWTIVKVYHAYAACNVTDDTFCRYHLHGLNLNLLQRVGFPNEASLIADFQRWLSHYPIDVIMANDPKKERLLFPHLPVQDVGLPMWLLRVGLPSYRTALDSKRRMLPINGVVCGPWVHSAFRCAVCSNFHRPSDTDILKRIHGYHCSLYDTYMIYLYVKDLNVKRPILLNHMSIPTFR